MPRRFGKPDLFITMTANPKWPEITRAIPHGSHWVHHQDIVARVFYLKLQAMIDIIVKKQLFGEVLAYVYRIEWQARGMPHAHCLFILKTKLLSPRVIDTIVWAEIPCPRKYPVLHDIVCQRMIHEPCDSNAAAPCRKKNDRGTCHRHFPKNLNTVTTVVGNPRDAINVFVYMTYFAGDGYPEYRRRNRFVVDRNGRTISDQWVVPYNPYLLETFDCHINVEVAAHRRSLQPCQRRMLPIMMMFRRCFKYVYKYCFKKPDFATVAVDEIETYITGRLLSASEAVWRLLELKMHKEHPAVTRLDVHLPDHQQVIFDPTADPRDIFEAAERSSSSLLEWFSLNIRDISARQFLYIEIPEHYVWKNNTWIPRSTGGMAIGRMYNVSIHNLELFALRTLLTCQRGCQSFSDVLMVDGFIHSTFRDACSAYGFIHDDSEFIASFSEYVDTTIASVDSIRRQFALMLCSIKVINAQAAFEMFASDLCGTESRLDTLQFIERIMRSNGKTLVDHNFDFEYCNNNARDYVDDVDLEIHHQLSSEQQSALDIILAMARNDSASQNIMSVIAPAGTGKTLFVHHAVRHLKTLGVTTMCVAASSLAANLLPQGTTAHSAFKIPVDCDDMSYCQWNKDLRHKLYRVDVVLWDEVSMVSRYVAETVDRSFRQLMGVDLPFGGKIFVFLGDFRQLPPVIRGSKGELFSLMACEWFQKANKAVFTKNYRARDEAYAAALELIGDGHIVNVDIPIESIAGSIDDAIERLYGQEITHSSNAKNMMLAFTLDQCAIINSAILDKIPSNATFSVASDDLQECKTPDNYPPEYISSLNIHGAPPAHLTLKQGGRYMIMRNIDQNICNGVLAEGVCFTRWLCTLRLLTGPGSGQIVKLPRCSFQVTTENTGLPFNFCRRQFPITPAYCVTVHKSQGQTLDKVCIVADTDPFAHGMVYVALSRVGSWSNVIFFSPRDETFLKNKVCNQLVS